MKQVYVTIHLTLSILLLSLQAWSGPERTTYQAKIIKPDGLPLEASNVNFKFTILDPAGACILYSETFSAVNMSATGGVISFSLGSGIKTYPASSTTFENVFNNASSSLSCDSGGPANYAPAANDIRKIVMQFHDGSGWQTLPAMSINAVPYAMYASESQKLGGLISSDFVQVSTVPTCTTSEALRYTGAGFSCVAIGSGGGGSVTSGSVITALGYTPADGASVTALSSSLTTTNSNISSVSSTVFSVSSTVTSLQSSVAASFAAIAGSQWVTSGTNIYYNTGNVGIGTATPEAKLHIVAGTSSTAPLKLTSGTNLTIPEVGAIEYDGANLYFTDSSTIRRTVATSANTFTNGGNSFGSVASIGTNDNNNLNIKRNGSTIMSVTSTGLSMNGTNSVNAYKISADINDSIAYLSSSSSFSLPQGNWGLFSTNGYSTDGATAFFNLSTKNALSTVQRGYMGIYSNSSGNAPTMVFGTQTGATAYKERMRIDASGNVGIGATTLVAKLSVSGGVQISMESATCATSYAGTLRYNSGNVEYCNGTSWQAFGVSGAGITNFNGSTSGTQSFATGTGGTAPNFNTSNGVHTLNVPLASTGSVAAGLLSNSDYTTFTNKITSSAASIAQVLGYVPADSSVSGTYAQKANNLSDLANIATARTNLGLGTFATASTVDLGGASATGTLAIARLPSFTGDATISAASNTIILSNSGVTAATYTKVTVDAKGRVTSGAQISSSDVTTALGYTPASATASTQWTTSGTNVFYNTGNVGIGTSAPTYAISLGGETARSIGVNRRITANSNGNNLLIEAGGATSGATNKAGGNLVLSSGFSTGQGSSIIEFQTAAVSGTGTFDNTPATRMQIDGYGNTTIISADPNTSGNDSPNLIVSNPQSKFTLGRYGGINRFASGHSDGVTQKTLYMTGVGGITTDMGGLNIQTSNMNITTGGISRLYMNSSGKFGIGTSVPGAKTEIYDSTSANTALLRLINNGTGDAAIRYSVGSGAQWAVGVQRSATPVDSFVISKNSTLGTNNYMTIDTSGNVGIGITSPNAKLELASGTASVAPLKLTSGTLLTSPQSGTIEYDGFNFYITDSTNTRRTIDTASTPGTIDDANNINATTNMTLTPVGSVVVSATTTSTSSNTGALIVKGGLGVAGNINSAGSLNVSGSSVIDGSLKLSSMTSGSVLFAGSNGTIAQDNTNFYWDEANKRLGLGTTSPSFKLEVSGTVTSDRKVGINGRQVLYLPDQSNSAFTGSLFVGDGGGSVSHTSGAEGYYNTGVGIYTLFSNTTGYENTANGSYALYSNTIGSWNTANGSSALQSNTTGVHNTANGSNVLQSNTTGNYNAANGSYALRNNTTGSNNTANGSNVLQSNTTGNYNTANGSYALYSNTAGSNNTANGYYALRNNTNGYSNTANGSFALQSNTIGYSNAANGSYALRYNTTGNNNTANGSYSLLSSQTKSESTAIGYFSMRYADDVSATVTPSYNTAIGAYSLQGSTSATTNTGTRNTALGHSSLKNMTSGSSNTAIGYNAGSAITTGSNNVILGSDDGSSIATLSNYVLIADGAGNRRMTIDGSGNVGIGTSSPSGILHLSSNAISGSQLKIQNTDTGGATVAIVSTGSANAGGAGLMRFENPMGAERMVINSSGNVGIGTTSLYSTFQVKTGTNQNVGIEGPVGAASGSTLNIFNDTHSANVPLEIRSSATYLGLVGGSNVGIGTTTPGYKLDVNGTIRGFGITDSSDIRLKKNVMPLDLSLEKILQIEGVSYNWIDKERSAKKQIGFIAQQVEKIYPELVETDNKGMKSVNYSHLVTPLVEAIKSLYCRIVGIEERNNNQERQIASADAKIKQLEEKVAKVDKLEAENAALKAYLCSKDPAASICK